MLFKTTMLVPIMIYVYSLILHNSLFLLHLLCFCALMFHHIIVLLMFVLTHPFEIWTRMGIINRSTPFSRCTTTRTTEPSTYRSFRRTWYLLDYARTSRTARTSDIGRTYSVLASLRSSESSTLGYRSSTLHFSLLLSIGMIWYTFAIVQSIDLSRCLN